MFLRAKVPIWLFISVAAIGVAVIILIVQQNVSVLNELRSNSIENAYWSKNIPKANQFSDWKTYRNEEYGFEVGYPNNYKVFDDYPDKKQVFIGTNETQRSPIEGVMIRATEENLSDLKNEIKNRDELTEVLEEKQITINSINVYKLVVSSAIGYNDAHYLFTDGKNNFEITWDSENQIQESILSTFKFIEPIVWKTYRNEEYGFEFKYPEEWTKWALREGDPNEIPDEWTPSLIVGLLYDKKDAWSDYCSMNIMNISQKDFNKIITDYRNETYTERLVNIDGINGVGFEHIATSGETPISDKNIEIFFNKGNNYYHTYIQTYHDQHEIECKNLADQILSTFKFIEPIVWKTYRNEEYGFEVKYPVFTSKDRIKIEQDNQLGTIIDFQNWLEAYKIFLTNFSFFIMDNPQKLSLQEWFAKNIDDNNSTLINKGVYRLITLPNGIKILRMQDIPIPSEFLDEYGPLGTGVYMALQSNEFIMGFAINGHDNSLDSYGFGGSDGYDALTDQILSTFKFIK